MVARTQKEIRRRAPLWFGALLVLNFILMSYSARDAVTKQSVMRSWAQAIALPIQTLSSGAGSAGLGFFQHIGNLFHAEAENQELRQRVEQMEIELRQMRAASDENERLKGLLD